MEGKIKKWTPELDKDLYYPAKIMNKLGLPEQTVYTRFRSRYRAKRWGVERYEMPDGTIKEMVHKKNLKLWKTYSGQYLGRPQRKS